MSAPDFSQSQRDALTIRDAIVRMLQSAGSGHAGGPLGMADVFAVLYRNVLQHRPNEPTWHARDRVLLSNGHICPVLYATLALHGYFPGEKLATFRQLHSDLQGHPKAYEALGIENTSGPLGQGLSQAIGVALAARYKGLPFHTWCLMSDGEQQEGQVWEAYQAGAKFALSNLTAIIDRNYIQISGVTEQIMPLDPLAEKLAAFGWRVYEVNGHDHAAVYQALMSAKADGEPSVIIACTEPGKGVSAIENKYTWHGYNPNEMNTKQALRELHGLDGQLETLYD